MILHLEQRSVDLLREEARKVHPVEACAILFGEITSLRAVVRKVVVTHNELRSGERFEINPETVVEAMEKAEKEGLEFLGLFHSHPAPPNPSATDLRFMKLWGEAIWLILSSIDHSLAAFQLKGGNLKEIPINLE
jgi:proteasome lid subunit RPN8/RPN11